MTSFHHSLNNLITKVFVTTLAFGIYLFIPKFIGPELFGTFSYISAFVGLIIPLSSLGIGSGMIYFLSNKQFQLSEVIGSISFIALVLACINAIIVLILFKLGTLYHFDPLMKWSDVLYFTTGIFFQTFSFIIGRTFYGNSNFSALNKMDAISVVLNPVSLLLFLYLFGMEQRIFLYVSFCCFSVLMFLVHLNYFNKFKMSKMFNTQFIHSSLKYGLKSWPGDLALRANLRLDQLILISNVSATALGIYSIAVKLVELIWMIPDALGPVLFNFIAGKSRAIDSLELVARIHRLLFYSCGMLLVLWAMVCYFFVIPYILGSDYANVIYTFLLLIPGSLILISSKVFTKLFSASGNVQWSTRITIIGSAISIIGYFILIPSMGMYGAAIASSLGYICLTLAGLFIMKTNYNIQLEDYFVLRLDDLVWLKSKFDNWRNLRF